MLNDTQINNRIQWVRDLVSGDFAQTKHTLKKRFGSGEGATYAYCCLGVACERIDPDNNHLVIQDEWNTSSGVMMPAEMALNDFGMSGEDQDCAASWNDRHGFDFSFIADFVAYATDHKLEFRLVEPEVVPDNYANTWLAQFTK